MSSVRLTESIISHLALLCFIRHDVNNRRRSAASTEQIQLIQRFQSSLQTHMQNVKMNA